jgi:hypothetical protein
VPHAPQHRECGIDLPAIIEIFVEQRGNHHSHRGIAASSDQAGQTSGSRVNVE